MNLAQRLKKWNGGVQRGAASKFARKMGVGPSAVTMWLKGTRPGEELLHKVAREFGITLPEAEAMFPAKEADLRAELAELKQELHRLQSQVADLMDNRAEGDGARKRGAGYGGSSR
jgi:transcriptional regulator with XRE-family HTH domain